MNNTLTVSKSNTLLNSYALIKSSWLKDDYISSFVPMAVALIAKKAYDTINVEIFTKDFEKEYGIIFPSQPAIKVLSILQKEQYITFSKDTKMWNPVYEEVNKINITEKQNLLNSQMKNIFENIITFAKETFQQEITMLEAENMFFNFIQANSSQILNGEFTEYQNSYNKRSIIAQFIMHTYNKIDNVLFGMIKQMAIGKLLVDAITLTEGDSSVDNFKKVSVYIDTRYILNMLGFYGEYRKNSFVDLTEKLYKQGAKLFIFNHNLREINYILQGCEQWIDSTDYDPEKASSALRYLKNKHADKKYVQELIVKLSGMLNKYHIQTDNDSLIGSDYQNQIGREALKEQIVLCYKNSGIEITDKVYETIECDVDSIQAIYYKRDGEQTFNVNQTKAIFLTTNRNLVYASRKFHSENFDKNTLPACISDIFVGTFIWARSGVTCCEDAMTSKLITDCAIAMEPPQRAIALFCMKINELKNNNEISEKEYIALKCYGLSTQAIQPLLVSNEYTYKDIYDVMDEIKQETIAKESAEFDKERTTLKKEIEELTKRYGIKEEELNKYRDMALRFESSKKEKADEELQEMISCAKKAEEKMKVTPIIINAAINIFFQIILFFINYDELALFLRILVPISSVLVGFAIQCNWLSMRDKIKFRLVFHYKKKCQNKKMKTAIIKHLQ